MTCYIHIGTAKTGTTSLQKFLLQNRENFEQFFYPSLSDDGNCYKLALGSFKKNKFTNLTKQNNLQTQEEKEIFCQNLYKNFNDDIKIHNAKDLIISSEHFSNSFDIEELKNFKNILCSFGITDFKIIVYIRDYPSFINALYNTYIKDGLTSVSIEEFPYNINFYKDMLSMWEEVFEKKNMIVRIFDKKELCNGSIIDDFLSILGVNNSKKLFKIVNQNESISHDGIQLLRNITSRVPAFVNNKLNPLRYNLSKYIDRNFNDSKYTMPINLYKKIDNEFKESKEWIRKNYFPQKKELFEKEKYPQETVRSIPEKQLNNVANLVCDILEDRNSNLHFSRLFSTIFSEIENIKNRYNKIAIYGYGSFGKTVHSLLNNKVKIIVEKNCLGQVSEFTVSIDKLKNYEYDVILICVLGREEEIIKDLITNNVKPNTIFTFGAKNNVS